MPPLPREDVMMDEDDTNSITSFDEVLQSQAQQNNGCASLCFGLDALLNTMLFEEEEQEKDKDCPPSPRAICRMWKAKRRAQRLKWHQEQNKNNGSSSDDSLDSAKKLDLRKSLFSDDEDHPDDETNEALLQSQTKQDAMRVQLGFNLGPGANMSQQYRREQYGITKSEWAASLRR